MHKLDDNTLLFDMRKASPSLNRNIVINELAKKHFGEDVPFHVHHAAGQEGTWNVWIVSTHQIATQTFLKIAKDFVEETDKCCRKARKRTVYSPHQVRRQPNEHRIRGSSDRKNSR